MIKLKTRNIKHKDAKKIKEFIKHINKEVDLHLVNRVGIIIHRPDKTVRVFGFYSPSEYKMYTCYEDLELENVLELIAHEYRHFLQDSMGMDIKKKKCEADAEKFAKEAVSSFLKNK